MLFDDLPEGDYDYIEPVETVRQHNSKAVSTPESRQLPLIPPRESQGNPPAPTSPGATVSTNTHPPPVPRKQCSVKKPAKGKALPPCPQPPTSDGNVSNTLTSKPAKSPTRPLPPVPDQRQPGGSDVGECDAALLEMLGRLMPEVKDSTLPRWRRVKSQMVSELVSILAVQPDLARSACNKALAVACRSATGDLHHQGTSPQRPVPSPRGTAVGHVVATSSKLQAAVQPMVQPIRPFTNQASPTRMLLCAPQSSAVTTPGKSPPNLSGPSADVSSITTSMTSCGETTEPMALKCDQKGDKPKSSQPMSTWTSAADVPADLSYLTVKEVKKCMELLDLGRYAPSFAKACVDGQLLLTLDEAMFVQEFNMSQFEARKLSRFAQQGWRPRL